MEDGVQKFIQEMYELGGFKSWGEYSREVGVLPSTISDWQTGKHAPSGGNLLRLIHAATDREPLALREAAERTSPLATVLARLQDIEDQAGRSREALGASLASIAVRLERIEAALGIPTEQDSEEFPP